MLKHFSLLTALSLAAFVVFSLRDSQREWKRLQRVAYQALLTQATAELGKTRDEAERKDLARRVQTLQARKQAPQIKQIILPDGEEADRCLTCHVELEGEGDWHDRTEEGRTFEEVGCVFCHGGNGAATTKEAAHEGLGEKAVHGKMRPHYVGAKKCRECHLEEYASWTRPNARMWQTFDRLKAEERLDPGCLKCHATGLDRGGYDPSLPATAVLREFEDAKAGKQYSVLNRDFQGVWCEACHGPGSEYVRIFESGGDAREAREQGGLDLPSPSTCVHCHTEAWSPDFSYDKYWADRCLHKVDWWRKETW